MRSLLLAVALFGLVHPGSKLLLDSGLSLEAFCLGTIGLRALALFPVAWAKGALPIASAKHAFLLALLGGVGALLQISEFVGIDDGVPVSTVSFLIYSYPVWILFIGRFVNGDAVTGAGIAKALVSLGGVLAIVTAGAAALGSASQLLAPIAASLFMALWICLSSAIRQDGAHPLGISLYYDLTALFFIFAYVFAKGGWPSAASDLAWLSSGVNVARLAIYAVLIGLVPNLLFFHASRSVPALTSGLVLLMEPVISTVVSHAAWGDELGPVFALGAGLILAANLPFETWIARVPAPVDETLELRGVK